MNKELHQKPKINDSIFQSLGKATSKKSNHSLKNRKEKLPVKKNKNL